MWNTRRSWGTWNKWMMAVFLLKWWCWWIWLNLAAIVLIILIFLFWFQVVSVNRTLAERSLGVWVEGFWTPTCSELHPTSTLYSLGPGSSWGPSPIRHRCVEEDCFFFFHCSFFHPPHFFENTLKIMCGHNLQEKHRLKKTTTSPLVLVHKKNIRNL